MSKIQIQYINLPNRPERKIFIEQQLNKHKLKFSRLNASSYHPNNPDNTEEENKILKRGIEKGIGTYGYGGIVGCYLSHVRAIQNIDGDVNSIYLNIEDDLQIKSIRFYTIMIRKIKQAPADWDILLADSIHNANPRDHFGSGLYCTSAPYPAYSGCHAVIINPGKKDKILKVLEEITIKEIDKRLLHYDLGLNTYAYHTGYSTQNKTFKSDINTSD